MKGMEQGRKRALGALLLGLLGAGCGAAGGPESVEPEEPESPAPPDEPIAFPSDAASQLRFLTRATFGPNEAEFSSLADLGYEGWLDEQLAVAPTFHAPALQLHAGGSPNNLERQEVWWELAVTAPDQLRQRVAFALSELFVVSDDDGQLKDYAEGLAGYYDLLVAGAFGSYRDLLEDVTRSPVMGVYLSMHKNVPADPLTNEHPDENYAREILQLFSIGLVELDPDGEPAAGPGGANVPTYEQADVEAIARAFTGWNFQGAVDWDNPELDFGPMENWSAYHDDGAKAFLSGVALNAGQSGEADLEQTLDGIFAHPNVPPFVAKHLIQRLVTSNPSSGYVQRVAAAFVDDGSGTRGNLGAVVRAVLTDVEAFAGSDLDPNFGKVREPLLRVTALWRGFDGAPPSGTFALGQAEQLLGQAPLSAPTVFNFFRPSHAPAGPVANAGLVAPELEIVDEVRTVLTTNLIRKLVFQGYEQGPGPDPEGVWLDFDDEIALAPSPALLVDHLDLLLLGGSMSSAMRTGLIDYLDAIPLTYGGLPSGSQRVLEAVYLILISPAGAVQA